MNSRNRSLISEFRAREFGTFEMGVQDQIYALLYLLFMAGLGILFFCAGLVQWSFSRHWLPPEKL